QEPGPIGPPSPRQATLPEPKQEISSWQSLSYGKAFGVVDQHLDIAREAKPAGLPVQGETFCGNSAKFPLRHNVAFAMERARLEVRAGRFGARVIAVLRGHADAARHVQQMALGIGH